MTVGLKCPREVGRRSHFDILHVGESSVGGATFSFGKLDVENVSILVIKFHQALGTCCRSTIASMVGLGTATYKGASSAATVIALAEILGDVLRDIATEL